MGVQQGRCRWNSSLQRQQCSVYLIICLAFYFVAGFFFFNFSLTTEEKHREVKKKQKLPSQYFTEI